jgi:hypothetical protein
MNKHYVHFFWTFILYIIIVKQNNKKSKNIMYTKKVQIKCTNKMYILMNKHYVHFILTFILYIIIVQACLFLCMCVHPVHTFEVVCNCCVYVLCCLVWKS